MLLFIIQEWRIVSGDLLHLRQGLIMRHPYIIREPLEKRKLLYLRRLYIDLCNCLILICSIQHQMKVNLWTKNSYAAQDGAHTG
ncbi:hypothetical protein HmCmsJML267_02451 [Escherichia coli]|nr:hypothetical protein HmCmsJML081_04187 [Escherichia coli]GDE33706.1 hypothetical protein HmCmsJML267_02451 [Escherichia coli]GDE88512.1 hypothetical protein HmCmsJML281_04025 [Escherichia coli]GDV05527.1 hypothetical protein BvCmsSIP024_04485 [Escherichia coli]